MSGFVPNGDNMARLLLETQREGYFTSDHLLKQVKKAVDIFEEVHPEARGIFLFDNAPSHRKVADDALNADKMNVAPGRKHQICGILCLTARFGRWYTIVASQKA